MKIAPAITPAIWHAMKIAPAIMPQLPNFAPRGFRKILCAHGPVYELQFIGGSGVYPEKIY